jgi:NTE family protein
MQQNPLHKKVLPFTLVLGGGGARGLAHVGVLKGLEKIGIVPSLIVGTSMGALVGGMYSQLRSADAVEKKLKEFLTGFFFKRIGLEQFSEIDVKNSRSVWERFALHLRQRYYLSRSALGSGKFAQMTLIQSLRMLLDEEEISRLSLRFAAVTSDLATGEEHVLTSGSLITAVAASSAIPGIIAPLEIGSHLFVDGKVTSTIPVPAACSLSKDPMIAVDVRRSLGSFVNHRRGFEIVIRAGDITSNKLNDTQLQQADIVLRPNVEEIDWNEFHRIDQCILAGEQAIEDHLQQITDRFVGNRFLIAMRRMVGRLSGRMISGTD